MERGSALYQYMAEHADIKSSGGQWRTPVNRAPVQYSDPATGRGSRRIVSYVLLALRPARTSSNSWVFHPLRKS